MAESWHLPVRELQGRTALFGIIRSSVTSMCPARDVGDDKISVVALLTSPYQHRDPQPCGLLRLLGSPPLPSLHWTSRSSCEDAQVRMAMALMSRFRNTCINLVSGSNTGSGLYAGALSEHAPGRSPARPRDDDHPRSRARPPRLPRGTVTAVPRLAVPRRPSAPGTVDGRTGPARQDLGQRSTAPCGQRVEPGPESSGLNCSTSTGCAPARRRPDKT